MDSTKFNNVLSDVEDMTEKQIEVLWEALRDQHNIIRRRKARELMAELTEGMRVQITGNTKPKYLAGQYGRVEKVEGTKALVKLDLGPQGKFRTGKVNCPLAMLKVVP